MSHPQIEEVSDSDPEIDDPTDFLPDSDNNIIAPANIPPPGSSRIPPAGSTTAPYPPAAQPEFLRPTGPASQKFDRTAVKPYQTLYPIYFDSTRTRAQGRRVSSKLATLSPLARTIVDAVSHACGNHPLRIAFEPDKLHPKDWANPGRVRVELYNKETHRPLHPTIKNKAHLYILVAKYLQSHPTTETDPLKLQIQGLPTPEKLEAPARPRGWKINEIVPLHSPALSGGGVNDNFMGDMMRELQAQGGGGQGSLPAGLAGMMNGMGLGGGSGGASSAAIGGPSDGGGGKKKKEKKKG